MILEWNVAALGDLAERIVGLAGSRELAVIGIDGHSSSGKTTLATRLAGRLPDSAVLHTDDLAWHHGVLSWDRLLIDDVLPVVRAGAALYYRPPAWKAKARPGAIKLPASLQWLIVEGVGANQPSLRTELDVAIWVETEEPTRLARDAPRLAAGEISAASYRGWMAEENAYVSTHRPWEHAQLILNGGETISHDRDAEVVAAASFGGGAQLLQ